MLKQLKNYLKSSLDETCMNSKMNSAYTIGLEHEMFLMSQDGLPSTMLESQLLFETLSKDFNWRVFKEVSKITKISIEHSSENQKLRYTQLKYDHEPHLIEIAFTFFDKLEDLENEIKKVFDQLQSTCHKLNLKLLFSSSCPIEADAARVSPTEVEWVSLRKFRYQAAHRQNREINSQLANYASIIAATQIHIGGQKLDWFNNAQIVHDLYLLEPHVQGWANLDSNPSLRWKPYLDVYRNYPLIGFPSIKQWDVDHWLNALLESPVFDPNNETNSCTVLAQHLNQELTYKQLTNLWKSTRDLQIIRPKVYGSLEFRADPAQNSVESIMALAALRLGLVIQLNENSNQLNNKQNHSFEYAYQSWWNQALSHKVEPQSAILEIAEQGLSILKNNEIKYLDYYKNILKKGAA